MPYWRTWRRYRYRPRRRWLRRRYTRRPFQRRLWRRRRRTVRKRKLKKIKIHQWQPQYIRKLKVVGYEPLFLSNAERLTNNFTCYKDSTAPYHFPGGGGFSIMNFTLNALYEKHLVLQNWWTNSNDNMPLIKYNGCTIYLYKEAEFDYLFQYNRAYPMHATLFTYTSTHPQAMLLHKHTKKILCKRNNRNKKPYIRLNLKPPTQFSNKWYFSNELANFSLLQTLATSCSLDRMYTSSTSISTTMGFVSLDTTGFQNHYFTDWGTQGYYPRQNELLFAVTNGDPDVQKINIEDLIYLGDCKNYVEGTEIKHIPTTGQTFPQQYNTDTQKKLYLAKTKSTYWGNVFKSSFFWGDQRVITTNKTWDDILKHYTSNKNLGEGWTEKTTKTVQCRYNPYHDKGKGNIAYLLPINSVNHNLEWGPPTDKNVITENLPLYTMLWGYLDYNRKCKEYQDIDTKCILVFQSPYVQPNTIKFFVPLDQNFLDGTSPYRPLNNITPSDYYNWHPKVAFQVQSVNNICISGPAVTRLPKDVSVEAHMGYTFYFKVGGSPPPMSVLTKPDEQPQYPIPNNFLQQPSLQSPAIPIEQLLWSFDERRGYVTKKAIQRITDYKQPETSLLSITDTNSYTPTLQEAQETSETSSSEEEETSLQKKLDIERRKQKLLRKRINQLLNRLTPM
nr:MAG: ORF1 [TTV-like mini virus]